MRTYLIIALTLSFAGCDQAPYSHARTQPQALTLPGLERLIAAIPAGQEGEYGLPGRDSLDRATLGTRYRMFFWLPGRGRSWADAVAPLQIWRAPLVLEGRYLALVTLAMDDGRLQAVELGAAALARELEALETPSPGQEPGILRAHSLGSDFLISGNGAARRAIPLASAKRNLKLSASPLKERALLDLLEAAGAR